MPYMYIYIRSMTGEREYMTTQFHVKIPMPLKIFTYRAVMAKAKAGRCTKPQTLVSITL